MQFPKSNATAAHRPAARALRLHACAVLPLRPGRRHRAAMALMALRKRQQVSRRKRVSRAARCPSPSPPPRCPGGPSPASAARPVPASAVRPGRPPPRCGRSAPRATRHAALRRRRSRAEGDDFPPPGAGASSGHPPGRGGLFARPFRQSRASDGNPKVFAHLLRSGYEVNVFHFNTLLATQALLPQFQTFALPSAHPSPPV